MTERRRALLEIEELRAAEVGGVKDSGARGGGGGVKQSLVPNPAPADLALDMYLCSYLSIFCFFTVVEALKFIRLRDGRT